VAIAILWILLTGRQKKVKKRKENLKNNFKLILNYL
jgi:bacteriorhodopsin